MHRERTTIPRMIYSRPYLLAYIALTLAQNIITTGRCLSLVRILYKTLIASVGMTACRLWSIHRQTMSQLTSSRGARQLSFAFLSTVLIESTLIYSITIILLAFAAFLGSNWYYCITDVVSHGLQLREMC